MTRGGKRDGIIDGAEGSEATAIRLEMNDMKTQLEAQMGAIQGDVNGLRGELGEIKDLLRSLVKPSVGDTQSRVTNTETRQEAEIEDEMRRRVRALADLDLNGEEFPTQSQQGDLCASNSPREHSVALGNIR